MRHALIALGIGLAAGPAAADGYDTVRAALDAGDYPTAYATLAEMGDGGDTLAMTMLSNLLLSEVAGPADLGLAVAWLEQAAAQGSVHAMLRLGAIHQLHGQALFPDRQAPVTMAVGFPEAADYYRQAEAAGSEVALSRLAGLYRLSMMSALDPSLTREQEAALARSYMERAVEAGRPDAMAMLAHVIRVEDPPRSAALFRRAATLGDQVALGILAVAPEMGGVTDPVEALSWAYAARMAWERDPNPRSPLFIMAGADTCHQFLEMMENIILAAPDPDRAAAEAMAAEIAAGWPNLLPGQGSTQGGGLFGRN